MNTDNIFNYKFVFRSAVISSYCLCDASEWKSFKSSWHFPRSSACSHLLKAWWPCVAYYVQMITSRCPHNPLSALQSQLCSWEATPDTEIPCLPSCKWCPKFVRKSAAASSFMRGIAGNQSMHQTARNRKEKWIKRKLRDWIKLWTFSSFRHPKFFTFSVGSAVVNSKFNSYFSLSLWDWKRVELADIARNK